MGGTASVGDTVINKLKQNTGVAVTRVAGKDRYEVNANAIAKQYTKKAHVVIASGEIYTDALYGVSYANTIDSPVLLSKKNYMMDSTVNLLISLGAKKATLIGGEIL